MRTPPIVASILASVILCSVDAATARAQDEAASRTRALQLFAESQEHYNAGRFDEASHLLDEAYDLFPEPILLYNAARAYERSGELAEAIDRYERYLRDAGEIEDRGAIERQLATLRDRVERERALLNRPATSPETPPPRPSAPELEPWPWVIAGVGVLGLGVGAGFGGYALYANNEAADVNTAHVDAMRLEKESHLFGTAANVAFIAGGIVALAGVIWGIVALVLHEDGQRADVGPGVIRF